MQQEGEHPGVTFVTALYRCRELGAALARFATAWTVYSVKSCLAAGAAPTASFVDHGSDDVSQGTAVVAKLVLKDLEVAEHQFTCQPTEEGVEAVQHLQQAVFGEETRRTFNQCVYLASLAQSIHALELVTAALLDVVSTHNCLSLFNVAAACGCAPLRRKAHALALASFPQALQQDVNGLMTMQEEHLLQLLCSDRLRVESEVEAFLALAAWTEHDVAQRKPGFAARLARCVRVDSLTISDLTFMDGHPLVVSDRMATMLVAQIYMHVSMGLPVDCPLGLPTISRRRRQHRQPGTSAEGAAAPPTAPAGCGLPEHAGHHGSVFAAAVCSFARARQQRQDEAAAAAAAACMRRLSVGVAGAGCSAEVAPEAPGSVIRTAPEHHLPEAPTPTIPACAPMAPALQPTNRVQHLGCSAKRVASRRTLFDMATPAAAGMAAELLQASKSPTGAALLAENEAAHAGGGGNSGDAAGPGPGRMLAGVTLEMLMSPNHASMRAMVQQAAEAAAALPLGDWGSRKRLRFQ